MSSLLVTILIALVLMLFVTAGLAIGLLLTGKSKLRRGCGYTPTKENKKNESQSICSICGDKKICEEKKDESSHDEH